MINKQYGFGNVVFQIVSPEELLVDSRFEAFAVEETYEADYTFEVLPSEPGKEPTAVSPIHVVRDGNRLKSYMNLCLLPKITVAQILSGVRADRLLLEKGQVMLHCSYVVHKGKALLFCAPSGTGKSTQAYFWQQLRDAVIVNEDRAIIGKKDGVFYAHGSWAMGKGTICRNRSVPIQAVILLGQGTENRVYKVSSVEIITRMIPQCSFAEKDSVQCQKTIDMVIDLIGNVPILGYDCIKDKTSVTELEKYL